MRKEVTANESKKRDRTLLMLYLELRADGLGFERLFERVEKRKK